jgi:predicted alpha/beta-hydrolase family hydrolase
MTTSTVSTPAGDVALAIDAAASPTAVVTLAHGAGADMQHVFMREVAARLALRGLTCVRHQFPYTEGARRRIDPKPVLVATIAAVVEHARARWPTLPLFVAGKSMGGRMATWLAADTELPGVRGLILLGFPLHPRGAVSTERAEHLPRLTLPSLFVHGTRDELGRVELLRTVLPPAARLHVIEHADHGFAVLKRSGRTSDAVLDELADAVATFVADVTRGTARA